MKKQAEKSPIPKNKLIKKVLFNEIQKNIPISTVDLFVVRKAQSNLEILLINRKIYPESGKWCLIGGRVLIKETLLGAIQRQAKKELGVKVSIIKPWNELNPILVFGDSTSDKQKHFIAHIYPVKIISGLVKKSGPEFSDSKWFNVSKLPKNIGFSQKKQIEIIRKNKKTILSNL